MASQTQVNSSSISQTCEHLGGCEDLDICKHLNTCEDVDQCKHLDECEHGHLVEGSIFFKKHIKVFSRGSVNTVDHHKPCKLCKDIYASWKYHCDKTVRTKKRQNELSGGFTSLASLTRQRTLESALDKNIALNFGTTRPQASDIKLYMDADQIGEAYHVLISQLLLKGNTSYNLQAFLNYFRKDPSRMGPIEDIFEWYQVQCTPHGRNVNPGKGGKKNATWIISAAFDASRVPGAELDPDRLFSYIRTRLDCASAYKQSGHSASNSASNLCREYFRTSYAAKYWLNRYFALTKKPAKSNVVLRGKEASIAKSNPKEANWANWKRLPKKKDIAGRLAVVHIRRATPSEFKDGRLMDNVNLKHVAEAIATANRAATRGAANDPQIKPFSHVLLYGDFCHGREDNMTGKGSILPAHALTALVKELTGTEVSVGFVSRPWENNSEVAEWKEVEQFWSKYRDLNFDHVPVQVKNLAIWVMLHNRYAPDICVIGHRSGFIEAAAFIGMPVFYLNNERANITGNPTERGGLLWTPVSDPEGDRLRMASDVMDTLIPIESFAAPPVFKVLPNHFDRRSSNSSKTSGQAGSGKLAKPFQASKRFGKAAVNATVATGRGVSNALGGKQGNVDNTSTPAEVGRKQKLADVPNEVLTHRVEDEYKQELAGALFMFMCCALPCYYKDHHGAEQHDYLPTWKQRVFLMHGGHAQDGQEEAARALAASIGQQWLKVQYEFTEAIAQEAKAKHVLERVTYETYMYGRRDDLLNPLLEAQSSRQRRSPPYRG